jgi:sugar lactone lactonase YvrE
MNVFTGTAGSALNQLNTPCDCAFDSNSGTLYINASSGTVAAGDNGNGNNITQLNTPKGVHFDSSSNSLYIANTGSNNIVRWILNATSWTLVAGSINGAAGNTSTLLNSPIGVALDSMGNVYVADKSNHRIQFYLASETNGTTIAGVTGISGNNSTLLNSPSSVVVDNQFNVYVADSSNVRVQEFSLY